MENLKKSDKYNPDTLTISESNNSKQFKVNCAFEIYDYFLEEIHERKNKQINMSLNKEMFLSLLI